MVKALLVILWTTSEWPTTTSNATDFFSLLFVPDLELGLNLDLLRGFDRTVFLLLVAASILASILSGVGLFSFHSDLLFFSFRDNLLLSGTGLRSIISRLLSIRNLALVSARPELLLFLLSLLILRDLNRFLLGQFFGLWLFSCLRPFLAPRLCRSGCSFFRIIFRSFRLSPSIILSRRLSFGFSSLLTLLLIRVRLLTLFLLRIK